MAQWQLASHLLMAEDPSRQQLILLGEADSYLVENPQHVKIFQSLPTENPPEEFVRNGALMLASERNVSNSSSSLWTSSGLAADPEALHSVTIHALSTPGEDTLAKAFASVGIQLDAHGELDIVLVDDYMSSIMSEINTERMRKAKPWLPIKLVGHTIWIGPRFGAIQQGPCWMCLAHRLRENRWIAGLTSGQSQSSLPREPSITATPLTLSLGVSIVAKILGDWARGGQSWPIDLQLVTFDTRTLSISRHWVRRRPQCPVCGSDDRAVASAVPLSQIVSPISGIVPRFVRTEEMKAGFYHARADVVQPCAEHPDRPILRPGMSTGKGRSLDRAEQGCLAEAIERYSIVFQGRESERLACDQDLPSIRLDELNHFSEGQYARRDQINAGDDERAWVPVALRPGQPIRWTLGRYLNEERGSVYLPSCYCYMWHPEREYCPADTNGCAAGTTVDDATVRSLYELIERDAAAIWWFNRTIRPKVALSSFGDPDIESIGVEFTKMGRSLHLLDIRTDLPLPVYAAISAESDGARILFGLGCHASAREAAYRALAELSQVWFWIGQKQTMTGPWHRWLAQVTLVNEPFLNGRGETSVLQFAKADNIEAPLAYLVKELESRGFTPAMIDLSRPDLPLKVVRTAVPGLRHFWPRLGPGRLYDLPVALGWLDHAKTEQELNPIPCLL
jgi:bacteriocin biosynthesis cyclodehydratase domain-containing protein